MEFFQQHFQILVALHVISVIAWMAGMLYLPRLFVYHADAKPGSELSETFKVMERRLLRGIINPAMIAAWTFGLLMLATYPEIFNDGWIYVKLGCVIALSALHGLFSKWRKQFAADANTHPAKFYRIVNEVPAVLMIVIVFMVIVKPF
jgi:putative membrane protein